MNNASGKNVGYMAKNIYNTVDMVHVQSGTVTVINRNGVVSVKITSLQCDTNVPILGLGAFVGEGYYAYDTSVTGLYIDNSWLYSAKSNIDYAVFTFVL